MTCAQCDRWKEAYVDGRLAPARAAALDAHLATCPACAAACPTAAIEWVEADNGDWLGDFAAKRASYNLTGLAAG